MRRPLHKLTPLRRGVRSAVTAAALLVAGCACDDPEWHARVHYAPVTAAEAAPLAECDAATADLWSGQSEELSLSADPELLAAARREAEDACRKAAASRMSLGARQYGSGAAPARHWRDTVGPGGLYSQLK